MDYKHPVSVLVVIHTPDLRVLMIERADAPGYWQSVTGSVEAGEDLAGAARREVAEETGIRDGVLTDCRRHTVWEIYPRWRHRYAPGVTHNTEHVFTLCVADAVTPTLAPREHGAWRWLDWREAAGLAFSPSNAEAIRTLAGC